MATGKALDGKPYAGNPHVRFDEGEVAPAATPRRGSLLYKASCRTILAAAAFAALSATALAGAAVVHNNIPYAPENGKFGLGSLYLPQSVSDKTPVVLAIHGGGWSVGDRYSIRGIAEFFCRDLGCAVFNIEYRLASATNRWPACGEDCVKAANWLFTDAFREHAGFSPKKIYICGGSAGGHLTLWTLVNLPPERVAGCVSISSIGDPGPDYALSKWRYSPLFGAKEAAGRLAEMNPIPRIRPGMAPVLCTHATEDQVVPIASHRAFADAYRAAGNKCDFFEYPTNLYENLSGHCIWLPKSNPRRLLPEIESQIRTFMAGGERVGVQSPSFEAPNDFGIDRSLKSLVAKAGVNWRDVAEKNRTTGLERLGGESLKIALFETMKKYVDPSTQSVDGVPLDELGEIAEAAFRGGVTSGGYGWALLKSAFARESKACDPVTAAKLLAGFDRGLAGVVPKGANGESVVLSPYWILTPFQTGTYRTTLPDGGYFESSWSNSLGSCTYDLRTSAKKVACSIRLALGVSMHSVDVNGEAVDFYGNSFVVEPDKDGCAHVFVKYLWAGAPRKNKGKQGKDAK